MRGFIHRYLEYLLVVGLAAAAAAAVYLYARSEDDTVRPAAAVVISRTCAELGITAESGREGSCRTATAELTVVRAGHLLRLSGVRARVRGTDVVRPEAPAGRARDRARVVVRLDLRNTGGAPLFADATGGADLYLVADRTRVDPDRRGAALPGAFPVDRPLAPGGQRSGELRFELSGPRAATARAAQLGIRPAGGNHIGVIRLALSRRGRR